MDAVPAHPLCDEMPTGHWPADAATTDASRGDVRWAGSQKMLELFLDDRGLKLDEWEQAGQLEVVKSGPHRSVYRLNLSGGQFYLKHYKINDWRALARNLLRPCKAVLEARAARRVADAGIETFCTVAVGCRRMRGISLDSYLITRSVENVQTLHEFVLSPSGKDKLGTSPRLRTNLARRLGELTAKLHAAKLVHHDFHPGNILIRFDEPCEPRLWLVDLHAVVRRRKVGPRAIENNLSLLNNFFARFATSADRLRFFRTYWEHSGRNAGSAEFAGMVRRVDAHCRDVVERAHRKSDRKWLRTNRRIVLEERGDRRSRGVVEFGRGSIAEFCDDAERLFERGHVRFWRRRTPRARLAAVDIATETGLWECYVRSQTSTRSSGRLSLPGRWSPLRRGWEIGHALRRRGINVPLPLFYGESKSVAATREYLVSERIANVLPLSTFLEHTLAGANCAARENWLRKSAERIACQVRQLHDFRYEHTELTAENLLVLSNMAVQDAWLIGLDQVHARSRLGPARIVSGLAELNNSLLDARFVRLTHRLRFLRAYLRRQYAQNWKTTWRAVSLLARKATIVEAEATASRRAFLAASIAMTCSLGTGCQMLGRTQKTVALPASHCIRAEQLLVLSDMKLPKDHPLIVDLSNLRLDVAKVLQLPLEKNPVIVYLFSNEQEYRQYLNVTYPKLPPRRAYFVGTSTELAVYTYWGDNIQEDLRHEYTHGLLHSCMKHVPLWIDEGLAEYFEVVTQDPSRVNTDYAQKLGTSLVNGWRPDIRRLEKIDEFSKMQQLDYQESWAWVHFLLHSTPDARQTLVEYINDLRTNPNTAPLSERMPRNIPDADARFLSYLGSLPQTRHVAGVL
ncbi:MAG: lipopolysaccharide kinase InaA family protein [Planctomycetaceae bacterium]